MSLNVMYMYIHMYMYMCNNQNSIHYFENVTSLFLGTEIIVCIHIYVYIFWTTSDDAYE